jgi:hypothetical protein
MAKRSSSKVVKIVVEVKPKKPRLVYRGMNAPPENTAPVQSQIVEIVDPSQMTVLSGGCLEYAHVDRNGGVPCDGSGAPLLEKDRNGVHQYTERAKDMLAKGRRAHLKTMTCKAKKQ